MATRSVVAYEENGKTHGTYVHYDGYEDHMLPELTKRFKNEGFEGIKNWIDKGMNGGGYRSVEDTEPFGDMEYNNWHLFCEEYGYLVSTDGSIEVFDNFA